MNQRSRFQQIRNSSPVILPSLLLCDFGNLEREVRMLEEAGVKALHLDVMDGNFVDNLSYGLPIVEAIRKLTELPLDVHLMINNPGKYIKRFCSAGADLITIHVEATDQPRQDLQQIRELGLGAGLALNPTSHLGLVEQCVPDCDLVLVMAVEAGFGGQKFNPDSLNRLKRLREIKPQDLLLQVDGGVNSSTIASCADAGAELFVVGSAIFRQANYRDAVAQLENCISRATT